MKTLSHCLLCLMLWPNFVMAVDYFVDEQIHLVRMSPAGERVVFVHSQEGEHTVTVRDVGSDQFQPLLRLSDLTENEGTVAELLWIDNETIYASVYELTDGVADLSDTQNQHYEFILSTIDGNIRYLQSSGKLLSALPDNPHQISYAIPGSKTYIYKIDTRELNIFGAPVSKTAPVDGGQFSRLNRTGEVPGYAFSWLVDASGRARSVMYWDYDTGMHLASRSADEEEWTIRKSWRAKGKKMSRRAQLEADLDKTTYRLVSIDPDPSFFLGLAENENGRQALYRFNVETDERELVYEHPSAEIVGVKINENGEGLLSVSYFEGGFVKQHFFQEAPQLVVSEVRALYPDHNVFLVDTDAANKNYTLWLYASNDPGWLLIYEAETQQIRLSQKLIPTLKDARFAKGRAFQMQRDEIDIEYFLTIPDATNPVPLVIYPHGGPFGVMDSLEYDPAVQFLAAQGIAVLQVNYRGSGGYGESFLDAGKGQFGALMLGDIEAALGEVSGLAELDLTRVCTMGDSYGGYAALMLAVRSPDRFKCVASFAGVTDVPLQINQFSEKQQPELVELFIGTDEERSDDQTYAALKDISPLYHLDQLKLPIMITHGKEDRRVDVEQSYRLELALRMAEKPVEVHYYETEGHGFEKIATYREHMERVGEFLSTHLRVTGGQ